MERKIDSIYRQYQSEMSEKWNTYFDKVEKRLADLSTELELAKVSGEIEAIKLAEKAYKDALSQQTYKNAQYQAMVKETAFKISEVNQIALDVVNDNMPSIYAFSYNEFEGMSKQIKGYSFDLVDESTVKFLAKNKEILLPFKEIDPEKDSKWNTKAINSQLMQGILQGESIPDISKRLQNVSDMDRVASIRNARTMTTSAENAGRQDSYEKAQEDGVILHKVWLSAIDARTRESHIEADGQEVEIDEPFVLTNPDGSKDVLMFPADPVGSPCQVYNCRCTMITKVIGFKPKG